MPRNSPTHLWSSWYLTCPGLGSSTVFVPDAWYPLPGLPFDPDHIFYPPYGNFVNSPARRYQLSHLSSTLPFRSLYREANSVFNANLELRLAYIRTSRAIPVGMEVLAPYRWWDSDSHPGRDWQTMSLDQRVQWLERNLLPSEWNYWSLPDLSFAPWDTAHRSDLSPSDSSSNGSDIHSHQPPSSIPSSSHIYDSPSELVRSLMGQAYSGVTWRRYQGTTANVEVTTSTSTSVISLDRTAQLSSIRTSTSTGTFHYQEWDITECGFILPGQRFTDDRELPSFMSSRRSSHEHVISHVVRSNVPDWYAHHTLTESGVSVLVRYPLTGLHFERPMPDGNVQIYLGTSWRDLSSLLPLLPQYSSRTSQVSLLDDETHWPWYLVMGAIRVLHHIIAIRDELVNMDITFLDGNGSVVQNVYRSRDHWYYP